MKQFLWIFSAALIVLQSCKDDDVMSDVTSPKITAYETSATNMKMSATYAYDIDNRITKILWKRSSPYVTEGEDAFVYDDAGRLKEQMRSITGLHNETIRYTWHDNVITAASSYSNNKKIGFVFYEYNGANQLISAEYYRREGDAGFLRTDSLAITYHPDGNLLNVYKYAFDVDAQRMVLVATQNFPEYLSSHNPLSTVEILPNHSLQTMLPKKYVSTNGTNSITYSMAYELRADGYPAERTVTSSFGTEHTVYSYDK